MPDPIMEREPIRLPLWATVAGSQAFALAIDLLSDVEWRTALIGVLATLGPVLWGTEVARGRAWSPLSVWLSAVQARESGEAEARIAQVNVFAPPPPLTLRETPEPPPGHVPPGA